VLAFNPRCDGVVLCNYVQVGLLSYAEQVQPKQNDNQVLPKMCDNCFEKYLNYTIYKADGPYLLIKGGQKVCGINTLDIESTK
jgi:hypothetical protein